MDCCLDDALKLDYLNGMLSEKESGFFEEHLAACPGCRKEIDDLRKTAAAIAGLTPPSVPAAWTAAAKNKLPLTPVPARRRTAVFQYAAITAGVTAGVVLLFWLVMGRGISELRAAGPADHVAWILSLHALLFVPSIIDNIYRIIRRGGS